LANKGNEQIDFITEDWIGRQYVAYTNPYPPEWRRPNFVCRQAYAASCRKLDEYLLIWLGHGLKAMVDKVDASALPAYDAYKFAAEELAGAAYLNKITNYIDDRLQFDSGNSMNIWLIWSLDRQDHVITYPLPRTYILLRNPLTPFSLTITWNHVDVPANFFQIVLPVSVRTDLRLLVASSGLDGWTLFNGGCRQSPTSSQLIRFGPDTTFPLEQDRFGGLALILVLRFNQLCSA
jgi:hypothetical protein